MVKAINKINVTAEAIFDINEILGLNKLSKKQLKAEIEYYITEIAFEKQLNSDYFCCDYVDEVTGEWVAAFVSKGSLSGLVQNWNIKGICHNSDLETCCKACELTKWLNTKIWEADSKIKASKSKRNQAFQSHEYEYAIA